MPGRTDVFVRRIENNQVKACSDFGRNVAGIANKGRLDRFTLVEKSDQRVFLIEPHCSVASGHI